MSGEFVCSADSLVYARGNAGTIKASFSWANNKKMARDLLRADQRGRETPGRLWGGGRM